MLSLTLRNRPDGPGRVEIHRHGSPAYVEVIAFSPRYAEASVGFTDGQACEMCIALLDVLPDDQFTALADALLASFHLREASAAGALGKNTDTDSHPEREAQRRAMGDCRLSADEPELPMVCAA